MTYAMFLCKKCKARWNGSLNEIVRVCPKCEHVGAVVKELPDASPAKKDTEDK